MSRVAAAAAAEEGVSVSALAVVTGEGLLTGAGSYFTMIHLRPATTTTVCLKKFHPKVRKHGEGPY